MQKFQRRYLCKPKDNVIIPPEPISKEEEEKMVNSFNSGFKRPKREKTHDRIFSPINKGNQLDNEEKKERKIELWEELNKKRLEPALIQINDYLYVFDNVNKSGDNIEISFERTNLLASKPKFELITPQLSENISGSIIPKFFGAAKESEESIIFLGGNILDEEDDNKDIKNYKYNIIDNKIEFSEVSFVNIQLKEKNFFNYNNKNDVYLILPDFYRKVPKVAFYIKSKNIIKIVDYMPNVISPKKENNIKEDSKDKLKIKVNFDDGTYIGEIINGMREGKGIFYDKNGDIYDGEWKKDKKEGRGTYIYEDGDVYEGEWKNDCFEGRGIFYHVSGSVYDGYFSDDQRHGKGIYYFFNGDRYEGDWKKKINI